MDRKLSFLSLRVFEKLLDGDGETFVRAKRNWLRKVGCKETKEVVSKFTSTMTKHLNRLKKA